MKNELRLRYDRVEGNDVYAYCENLTIDEIVEE